MIGRSIQVPDALLYRGIVRLLGCLGDTRSDRIQINIGHTGEDSLLVQQRLGLESPLPEMPGTAILFVRAPRYMLVQTTHKPA